VPGIYDEPELYEAACAYRDVPGEVSALLRWSGKHGDAGPRSVLELAAGPAEHSRELARRGLDATTLDLSPAMCARARELAAAAGIALTVVQGDMRDFSIPRQFDLAITMLNSLCHLLTLDDLLHHLACLARHVAPGGLYIVELAHPADFLAAERRTSSEWSSEFDGGTVSVRWGGGSDEIDPITQITREHVRVTYSKRGGGVRTVTDVVPNRFWTATEFEAAVPARARAGGVAAAIRTLPRDIASFTGRRQELQELVDAAIGAAGSGGIVGIHAIGGMAGIGKTAFAVHAAHRLADRFPGGQIFLPLHGHTPGQQPVDPADALASLLLTAWTV